MAASQIQSIPPERAATLVLQQFEGDSFATVCVATAGAGVVDDPATVATGIGMMESGDRCRRVCVG